MLGRKLCRVRNRSVQDVRHGKPHKTQSRCLGRDRVGTGARCYCMLPRVREVAVWAACFFLDRMMSGSVSCFGVRKFGEFAFWLRTSREKHACFDWVGCCPAVCLVRSAVVEGEWTQYLIGVLTRTWSLTFV